MYKLWFRRRQQISWLSKIRLETFWTKLLFFDGLDVALVVCKDPLNLFVSVFSREDGWGATPEYPDRDRKLEKIHPFSSEQFTIMNRALSFGQFWENTSSSFSPWVGSESCCFSNITLSQSWNLQQKIWSVLISLSWKGIYSQIMNNFLLIPTDKIWSFSRINIYI